MLTSKSQDSDRFWGMKQGADGYMTKPVDENELLTTVARLLPRDP
jgi:twitching motility two-component system response regulator PilH